MITGSRAARPVIVVTGLAVEARIAQGADAPTQICTIAGGGDGEALAVELSTLVDQGACGILSFGIAGGLAPDADRGRLLIARRVVTSQASWTTDARWSDALAVRLPGAVRADIAGSDLLLAGPAMKAQWHRSTGAFAVDTESHVAATVAFERDLPFAVLRAVSDGALRTLPPAARIALRPRGKVNLAGVFRSLLATPAQLPALWRTAVDARDALRALAHGRRLLGRGLACPDFGELHFDMT